MQNSRARHCGGYRQSSPQHNVFKNRNTKYKAGEACMENLDIGNMNGPRTGRHLENLRRSKRPKADVLNAPTFESATGVKGWKCLYDTYQVQRRSASKPNKVMDVQSDLRDRLNASVEKCRQLRDELAEARRELMALREELRSETARLLGKNRQILSRQSSLPGTRKKA